MIIWPFTFFIRMSKDGNSFELCCMVNFILGCRFCSWLYNSLMSPHGHFQNMKKSSKYFFHDLGNSSFMSLPYFLPIISHRFSSKYARVWTCLLQGSNPPLWPLHHRDSPFEQKQFGNYYVDMFVLSILETWAVLWSWAKFSSWRRRLFTFPCKRHKSISSSR